MDLIEILILVFFIVIPVLDGILKQRRKSGGPGAGTGPPGPSRSEEAGTDGSASAADMVPEDLWAILTGQRPRRPAPETRPEPAPWSQEPEPAGGPVAVEPGEDWDEPWAETEETRASTPTSLEYRGPEAYSLETPAPRPIERTVPTPEERHEAFHERIDRRAAPHRRRASPVVRALRHPTGLRQAVILKEVLGPPRGLE